MLSKILDGLTPKYNEVNFSGVTMGTLIKATVFILGKVVFFRIHVKNSNNLSDNSTAFWGFIEPTYRPRGYVAQGVGMAGSALLYLSIRNTGATSIVLKGGGVNANSSIIVTSTYFIN